MMNGNILFIIGGPINTNNFTHLGHELHTARSLIFDLLCKKIISVENTTIVTIQDRLFLYNHIFKNTISHYENKLDLNNYKYIVNLDNSILTNPRMFFSNTNYFHNKTNYIFNGLYNPIGFNKYNNIEFTNLVTNCNANVLNPFDNEFIIIHYRNYKNVPDIKCWNYKTDDNIEEFINLLFSLKKNYKNIVIFGNLNEIININDINIKLCNNLQDYVSYMKSDNCKAIISVWSGAGQLGQFFFNKEILYYMSPHQTESYKFPSFSKVQYNNTINDIFAWDFQTFSKCTRYWFNDLKHLQYLFDTNNYTNLDYLYNKYLGTKEFISFGLILKNKDIV
jgi:hypothetical protein